MSDELNELKKISRLLTMANAEALETQLGKYATTDERKKVWILIDGQRMPEEIIKTSGMGQSTLYKFLSLLTNADLIEVPYGKAPKKKLEFVPSSWLTLLESEKVETKPKQKGDQSVKTTNQ
jgi:hypothetical protein